MRYFILVTLFYSINSFSQSPNLKLTDKDTLLTCGLVSRGIVTGPFSESHSSEFENLVAGVFKASRFPFAPYSMYHMNNAGYLRVGCQKYDETDYYTFFLYNLDSIMEFNLKARTKYGLMAIIAHEVGHHAFNHFLRSQQQTIKHQELQADYFAGFTMASFNVPRNEVTKGIALVTKDDHQTTGYPSRKERLLTTLFGYDVGMQSSGSPLSLLGEGSMPSETWMKKWSRKVKKIEDHVPVMGGIFDADSKFVLDKLGQFIYQHKGQNFVVARAIPAKGQRYPYMIFDNYFNYWWIDREGTIWNSSESKVIGKVNVNVLK